MKKTSSVKSNVWCCLGHCCWWNETKCPFAALYMCHLIKDR
ncbi:hypothetical protein CUMW_285610, partial [Citrus unshiu]